MDFNLVVAVNININNHFILVREVLAEDYVNIGVAETFVRVVFFDDKFCTVNDILCDFVAFHQLQAFLNIVAFAFFQAVVVDFRDTGLSTEFDLDPSLVAIGFDQFDTCLCKKSLMHKPLDGIGDFIAGDFHSVAHFQARVTDDEEIVIVGSSCDVNSRDFIGAGH